MIDVEEKELANKSALKYFGKAVALVDVQKLGLYKDGFLDGLKAGNRWHDLRKDPNDLPNGYRVVLNQVGMATQYDPNRGFLGFGGAGIIAWCEIPTFDKE